MTLDDIDPSAKADRWRIGLLNVNHKLIDGNFAGSCPTEGSRLQAERATSIF
jgi:hypothetical protein